MIGKETRQQFMRMTHTSPSYVVACVGGGSNAMGMFFDFLKTKTKLIGVEAAGEGIRSRRHSASLLKGEVGVLHGMKSRILQTNSGQIALAHSVSAGLDYPGVGPEHAFLKQTKRVEYVSVTDREALAGFHALTHEEGIMPALESSHAVAYAMKLAKRLKKSQSIVICLSGRGDKDIGIIQEHYEK